MIKKFVLLSATALLLVGCSVPSQFKSVAGGVLLRSRQASSPHSPSVAVPACAKLVTLAFIDGEHVHSGAYDCFSSSGKDELAAIYNITSDQDFESFAQQPPTFNKYKFVRIDSNGIYSFRATGNDTDHPAICVGVQMNSDGQHVDLLLNSYHLQHC